LFFMKISFMLLDYRNMYIRANAFQSHGFQRSTLSKVNAFKS
jgi:hypothetical protein